MSDHPAGMRQRGMASVSDNDLVGPDKDGWPIRDRFRIVFDSLCRAHSEAMLGCPLLPLTQIKCSFQNACGNRKTVRAADCFLHPLNVIQERVIFEHPFDRCYKISWGC